VRLDSERREDDPFGLEFEVESYLEGHARRFIRQFDPNCYLYLSRSMDWFDLGEYARSPSGANDVLRALAQIRLERALAIGVATDILFPLQQQQQIAEGLRLGGTDADCLELPSPQGHDAFLVDIERFGPAVSDFLASLAPA
jgi:homoserine O-acetyltransferase